MAFANFARSGALRRNLIPAGAAAVVGVVAWILIRPMLSGGGDEDDAAASPPPEPTVEVAVAEPSPTPGADTLPPEDVYPTVLVMRTDVEPGVVLGRDLVEWREWHGELDRSIAVVQGVVPLGAVLGSLTQQRFREGDLVAWPGLLLPGHPGFISAALEPGMRAVTVEVDRATTAANIIYPGDRVDVIMVSTAAGQDGGAASRTIVRNTRVLAVGSTVLSVGRYGAVDPSFGGEFEPVRPDGDNYTLEVYPSDVERIAVASQAGRLTLAMRSIRATAATGPGGRPVRADEVMQPTEPRRVRVIRGSEATVVELDRT